MRNLLLLSLALVTAPAGADELGLVPTSPMSQAVARRDAIKLRNAGIATSVSAALCVLTGVGVALAASRSQDNDGSIVDGTIAISALTAGGVGLLIGLPLLGVGQSRLNQGKNTTVALSPGGATTRF